MRESGYILAQDPDRVVIVTGCGRRSTNVKTGGMLQVWILAKAQNPLAAIKSGLDALVCGDCPHKGGACYVRVHQAPLGIWRKRARGGYKYLPKYQYADVFSGRIVRWGAYGDPFYIPLDVIRWASFYADGHTGYTHQWRQASASALMPFLMASTDSEQERLQASRMGWRTFRVRATSAPLMPGEITCPASGEAGKRTTCANCQLCDGNTARGIRKDITILAHGMQARKFAPRNANTLVQISLGKVA